VLLLLTSGFGLAGSLSRCCDLSTKKPNRLPGLPSTRMSALSTSRKCQTKALHAANGDPLASATTRAMLFQGMPFVRANEGRFVGERQL
jgi:hypothetical protein